MARKQKKLTRAEVVKTRVFCFKHARQKYSKHTHPITTCMKVEFKKLRRKLGIVKK